MDIDDLGEDHLSNGFDVQKLLPTGPAVPGRRTMENEEEEGESSEDEGAEDETGEVVEAEVVEEKRNFFQRFPRLYWVVDSLEFFERGAFYGALAVLPAYVVLVYLSG